MHLNGPNGTKTETYSPAFLDPPCGEKKRVGSADLRPEVSEELGSLGGMGCRGVKSRLPQEHGFLWRR